MSAPTREPAGALTRGHRWSGWQGAICLDCGSDDPLENAIGDNWYDAWTGTYDTPEHEQQVKAALVCPGPVVRSAGGIW